MSISTAAILAGGLATRMHPLTTSTPKSLITVCGEPFIAHQLRLLSQNDVKHVILCVGHLGNMIEGYVGDGSSFSLAVEYSYDGDKLLDTAGALKRAIPLLPEEFFVLYGDSYLDCDYSDVGREFLSSGKSGLMTVYRNDGKWDQSNVLFDDGNILSYDKENPHPYAAHIDYGLGVFSRSVFEELPHGVPYSLATVYKDLLQRQQLAAFEVEERFYEIGSIQGLTETITYLENRMLFSKQYLNETNRILLALDCNEIEKIALLLAKTREEGGRLFILGSGGGAGHASHAVNDFRKIAGIECYSPTDNVSELTARVNDEGWHTVFSEWLKVSRLNNKDMILVFSVGGGNAEKNVSPNIVEALKIAQAIGCRIAGIVGRDGGFTAQVADACVIVPIVNQDHTTPHTEAVQAVIWHLLVTHPSVKKSSTKWESVK